MVNKLKLVNTNTGKFISKNTYEGYNQIITVANDGYDVIVKIEPYDPILGVQIMWNSPYDVWITPPTIKPEDTNQLKQNMDEAVYCIEELRRRYDTLIPCSPKGGII